MTRSILDHDPTIRSEELEPTAAYLCGRWFAKVEHAKASGDAARVQDAYACFWMGLAGLRKVSVACPEAVHFSLATSSVTNRVARMIENDLGFDVYKHPAWKF